MKAYKGMLSVVCCWCLCLSLCSFSFAENSTTQKPVEVNDALQQIQISNQIIALQKQKEIDKAAEKLEAQRTGVCEEEDKRRLPISDAYRDLTPEEIAAKEAYYAKEEAQKTVNSSSVTEVPDPVLERKLNAETLDKITVDAPVVNEPKAPRPDNKTEYYNQLKEDHATSFNGPTLPDFIRPSEGGSRTGTVDASIIQTPGAVKFIGFSLIPLTGGHGEPMDGLSIHVMVMRIHLPQPLMLVTTYLS